MYLRRRQTASLRYLAAALLGIFLPLLLVPSVSADTNSAIAQQFSSGETGISAASLVVLKEQSTNTIELAQRGSEQRLVGVVSDTSAIELSASGNGAQVVTSGTAMTLVSDINGTIQSGDRITTSPIKGVGMKATESGTILGTAQANLVSDQADSRTISDKNGASKVVHIGLVPVQVGIVYYSVGSGANSAYVPDFLQTLADSIAGRNVSTMRVLAAALVVLLVLASIAALLYGAIRSSIISIGRNPLSESAVRKSLYQVALTVLGVLVFSGIAIYLILIF